MARMIQTPNVVESDFSQSSARAFWKRVLPKAAINYIDKSGAARIIDFDDEYLNDVVTAYEDQALDQTPFVLADADNRHTMDPERFRGEVTAMRREREGEAPGLWAKIKFADEKAAKAVVLNPKLGVSARIREGIERSDGKTYKRAAIHILGTLDPKVTSLGEWEPAVDLSEYASDELIDLSSESYGVAKMPKAKTKSGSDTDASGDTELATSTIEVPKIEDVDPADIAEWDDATLDAFLGTYASDVTVDDGQQAPATTATATETSSPEGEEPAAPEAELSNTATTDIDFANHPAVIEAKRDARQALNRAAEMRWAAERETLIREGVPSFVLDLAEPVLSRANDTVLDLSNYDEDDLNVTEVVRELVDGYKGTVDLSHAEGHGGVDTDDTTTQLVDRFKAEFPI